MLVDRYFYDQIANIKYLDIQRKIKKQSIWQTIAEEYTIKPDVKIYLKIEPEKIFKRKEEVEQGLEYLQDKYKLYEQFSKNWKLTKVNGDDDLKNIQNKIKNLLESV